MSPLALSSPGPLRSPVPPRLADQSPALGGAWIVGPLGIGESEYQLDSLYLPAIPHSLFRSRPEGPRIALRTKINNKINTTSPIPHSLKGPLYLSLSSPCPSLTLPPSSSLALPSSRVLISSLAFALSRGGIYFAQWGEQPRASLPTLSKPSPKFLGVAAWRPKPSGPGRLPSRGLGWRAGVLPGSLSPGPSSVPLSRQVSGRAGHLCPASPRPAPRPVPRPPALLRWQCPRGRCAAGGRAGCRTCGARALAASWGGWACSPACRGRGRGGGAP